VPPKTEDSSRTVPLPDFCLNALKEHAERQADERDGAPHTSPASSISTATSEKAHIMESRPGGSNNGAIAGAFWGSFPMEPRQKRRAVCLGSGSDATVGPPIQNAYSARTASTIARSVSAQIMAGQRAVAAASDRNAV